MSAPARPFDPDAPLVASGNLRRRARVSRVADWTATLAAVVAVAVLGILVLSVAQRGASAISWDFLTQAPPRFGGPGGGIGPMIVGTALIVAVATAIAAPIGVLVAVFMVEFAPPKAVGPIRLMLDLLNGMPSIIIGLFVFGLLVADHHQSGFAGAVALSIIMVPLVARSTQEVLHLAPQQMRDAADALGVSRWRAVIGVVLPSAAGGIVTGTVLAIARAAGETAPLIFTSSIFAGTLSVDLFGTDRQGIPNIPVLIFTLSDQADPYAEERAWGAALVLLLFILIANVVARALLARSQRKLSRP
jgi:phosphate transport system permease protein